MSEKKQEGRAGAAEKHTPEPGGAIDYGYGNARRAVACVNALAGIPTEAIDDGAVRALVEAARAVADGPRDIFEKLIPLRAALAPFVALAVEKSEEK